MADLGGDGGIGSAQPYPPQDKTQFIGEKIILVPFSEPVSVTDKRQRHWHFLRLDNTGAWVVEVNTSLLCNRMTENVELYTK